MKGNSTEARSEYNILYSEYNVKRSFCAKGDLIVYKRPSRHYPQEMRLIKRAGSCRFEDHIGIRDRIAGANQADRRRHTALENNVRLIGHGDAGGRRREQLLDGRRIMLAELAGHKDRADHEIRPDRVEHLQDGRDVVDQRDVHGLDHGPIGKPAIGDNQHVGVPHPAQQCVDVRV